MSPGTAGLRGKNSTPWLQCLVSRALRGLWSGTEGTDNYFLVPSLNVHASGELKQ